jgi:hypothetical protein
MEEEAMETTNKPVRLSEGAFRVARALTLIVALLIAIMVPAGEAIAQASQPALSAPRYLVVENAGQFAPEARFMIDRGEQRIWLTEDAVWLVVADPVLPQKAGALAAALARPGRGGKAGSRGGCALRFSFDGGNKAKLEPFGRVSTRVSFLIGSQPSRWQRDVPVWSGARYRDIYPGIDLVVGGDATGAVPWRLEAQPGADANEVRLQVQGAGVTVGGTDKLRFQLSGREVLVDAPTWSLDGAMARGNLAGTQETNEFALAPESAREAGAAAAAPQATSDLIYSRVLGGVPTAGAGVAVDSAGNAYITGATSSTTFPGTVGHYDASLGGPRDAFVAKLNASATEILYATYLGGSGTDTGAGIAVANGVAYVTGSTDSHDFPGTSGTAGGTDAFVVTLDALGNNLGYAVLLGGAAGNDSGAAITLEGTDAYIVGSAGSYDLPGKECARVAQGTSDALVARIDGNGAKVYVRCLGGTSDDRGYSITVVSQIAYIAGETWSDDIIYPPAPRAGENDILVAAVGGDGATRGLTLIGGALGDQGNGIAAKIDVGGSGSLYVAGTSNSNNLALATPRASSRYDADAITVRIGVSRLASGSVQFTHNYSAYFGGSADDAGRGIAVDAAEKLYVAGATASTDFPVTTSAYDVSNPNGTTEAFVARMDLALAGSKVTYATYLGAAGEDAGEGIATDGSGNAFVTGSTTGNGFPVTVGAPPANDEQGFIAKLRLAALAAPAVSISASGSDVVLRWDAVTDASGYEAYRSATAYFMPGDNGAVRLPDPTVSPYTDPGVLAQVGPYFYVIRSIAATTGATSDISNRVGKFTFDLVKGN